MLLCSTDVDDFFGITLTRCVGIICFLTFPMEMLNFLRAGTRWY